LLSYQFVHVILISMLCRNQEKELKTATGQSRNTSDKYNRPPHDA
jgi:hypothetical protein